MPALFDSLWVSGQALLHLDFFWGKTKGALNYTIPQDGIMIVLLMLKL